MTIQRAAKFVLGAMSLAVLPLLAGSSTTVAWQDPLVTPAVSSALAASTQLLSVGRAGARLVAVGWRGHIVVSDDQGKSWRQVPSPVSIDLTAVEFASDQVGWAVGHGGVLLKTADAGATWSLVADGRSLGQVMNTHYSGSQATASEAENNAIDSALDAMGKDAEQPWLGVRFSSVDHGWIYGAFGLIMETRDGGASWLPAIEKVDNGDGLHLTGMAFVGRDAFIASEQGVVFRRREANKRFEPLQTGYHGTFFGIVAVRGVLFAYGLRGNVYRSADGGTTWGKLSTGTSSSVTAAAALPDDRVVLVTLAGEVLTGAVDDDRMSLTSPPNGSAYFGVSVAGAGALALVGPRGALVRSEPDKPQALANFTGARP
jgi:photosystem II stability/assembly factor-like uncharacterized protein